MAIFTHDVTHMLSGALSNDRTSRVDCTKIYHNRHIQRQESQESELKLEPLLQHDLKKLNFDV